MEKAKAILLELKRREKRKRFLSYFPDEGPHRRELYPRHIAFFSAGAKYRQRCFMAANRVGKTLSGALETTFHLTGVYPGWWEGRVFERPVNFWAAGKTNETTRDVVQRELLGPDPKLSICDGLIPDDLIVGKPTWKQGVNGLVDTILIKHKCGGNSRLGFKAYNQGRESFEGTGQDGIWCDEEVPKDIWGEVVMRTATTKGIAYLTFTPLKGLSEIVTSFMPKARYSKHDQESVQ
jgi:phage terminase large subunit-like protein